MELLLELFTSPACPHCPAARRIAENVVKQLDSAVLIERDVSLPENADIATRYGVRAVPAMVVNSEYQISGAPRSEDELYSHLLRMR